MNKKRIAVLMGGASSEHEISLYSGTRVVEALDASRYDITVITITKMGDWVFPESAPIPIANAIQKLDDLRLDCVFLALHGAFGEDGRIQGMLDLPGLPYTSSGCAASALAFDKIRSKAVAQANGIRVADQLIFRQGNEDANAIIERILGVLGLPCVLKSPCQGSSVGMAIPESESQLKDAIDLVFGFGNDLMAERYLRGAEVTCGILDIEPGVQARYLPVTEIRPVTSKFFDYQAKYEVGASVEVTPAEIPAGLAKSIQEISLKAHEAIGCSIWSRHDFIVDADGPVWLEVNTIPGMTQTSLFPQGAAAIGIAYPQMLDLFIEGAIKYRAFLERKV